MLQSLNANTTQAESLKFQLAVTEPMKKQAWKQIIASKIENQAAVLALAGKNKDILIPYYNNGKSGDSDNREGFAAKVYRNNL